MDLLTPKEVAALLRISQGTLENMRSRRAGPPWVKLGTSKSSPVRYPREAVEKWLREAQPK